MGWRFGQILLFINKLKRIAEWDARAWTALLASLLLISSTTAWASQPAPEKPLPPAVFNPLQEALELGYNQLFNEAPSLEFSSDQVEKMRHYEEELRDYCKRGWQDRIRQWESDLKKTQQELRQRTASIDEQQRHRMHCRIQNLRVQRNQAQVLVDQGIPTAFENRLAKLDIIEKWPAERRQIEQELASGTYHSRQHGDVKDIGFRDVGSGQQEDVKKGRDAIEEMKISGLMPKEIENEFVRRYVTDLAKKIAARSDLHVPVQVTVLNSKEVNAFALPGGFLFVQRGLLEEVEDEAQLAGVLAHEIAHAAARHGHQLMKRATVASIIYQAAQVAAMIFTGGVASIGMYYALQYGFYGLGLVLSLDLLGVSREFELEADQLGVQYAWNAGYDPSGFIRFFDKMAHETGYVKGLSWFRTHPPFYTRMVQAKREIMFLPKKENLIRQTSAFQQMKEELAKVTAEAEEEEQNRPSLLTPEEGCPKPETIDLISAEGSDVERICALPR